MFKFLKSIFPIARHNSSNEITPAQGGSGVLIINEGYVQKGNITSGPITKRPDIENIGLKGDL